MNFGLLLQHHLGDPPRAETLFRAALALPPAETSEEERVSARYNYGQMLAARNDTAGAEAQFRAALALAPRDPAVLNALALLLSARGPAERPAVEAMLREALAPPPLVLSGYAASLTPY